MNETENGGALAADGLPPLRAVIERFDLAARKALGQNFLLDLNLTRRIARAAAPLGDVLEIGPGPGGLTRALLMEGATHVVAIERDERCLEALSEISAHWPGRLNVIAGDALEVEQQKLCRENRIQIVANLPYNIGTELIVRWLRAGGERVPGADEAVGAPWWSRITVMLQREVAERIVATVGQSAYGRLSVLTAWRAEARILFDVSPRAFTPPPKVTSSIVQITPAPQPRLDCALEDLERITAAAFNQRRKMLRRSLKALNSAKIDAEALLEAAQIDPTRRAETLSPNEFARLAIIYRRETKQPNTPT